MNFFPQIRHFRFVHISIHHLGHSHCIEASRESNSFHHQQLPAGSCLHPKDHGLHHLESSAGDDRQGHRRCMIRRNHQLAADEHSCRPIFVFSHLVPVLFFSLFSLFASESSSLELEDLVSLACADLFLFRLLLVDFDRSSCLPLTLLSPS